MANTFPGSQNILLSPALTQTRLLPGTPPAGGSPCRLLAQVPAQAPLLLPHSLKARSSAVIWILGCLLLTSIFWALSSHLSLTFPDGLGHVPSSFFQHTFVLLPYHDGEDVPPSTQGQSLLVGSQFPTSGHFTPSDFVYSTALGFFFPYLQLHCLCLNLSHYNLTISLLPEFISLHIVLPFPDHPSMKPEWFFQNVSLSISHNPFLS